MFDHKLPASARLGEVSVVSEKDRELLLGFATTYSFEYFDTQQAANEDETVLVRGMTLGDSRVDTAYLFGAFEDYDMTFVQRVSQTDSGQLWISMAVSLHTAVYMPHVLIGGHGNLQVLVKELGLQDLRLHEPVIHETQDFEVYATTVPNSTIKHIISPLLISKLIEAVPQITVEVLEDTIYLSVKREKLSNELLVTLLQNGVRLARYIDEKMGAA